MAKVVYRGISYDTQERREEIKAKQQTRWFNEIGYWCNSYDSDYVVMLHWLFVARGSVNYLGCNCRVKHGTSYPLSWK